MEKLRNQCSVWTKFEDRRPNEGGTINRIVFLFWKVQSNSKLNNTKHSYEVLYPIEIRDVKL